MLLSAVYLRSVSTFLPFLISGPFVFLAAQESYSIITFLFLINHCARPAPLGARRGDVVSVGAFTSVDYNKYDSLSSCLYTYDIRVLYLIFV